ncbi:MAG: carboxymuconolactone decarboxylase family protein, partial [Candidatus Heimdallarchaeota archaeon]|nr:carboxymuconolactone decarboxylase family protein [Candidatus Heimdallarchaeota archaeon]
VSLIVGGSIVIPEMRRAVSVLSQLREKQANNESTANLL